MWQTIGRLPFGRAPAVRSGNAAFARPTDQINVRPSDRPSVRRIYVLESASATTTDETKEKKFDFLI